MYPHCTVRIRLLYAFNKYFDLTVTLTRIEITYAKSRRTYKNRQKSNTSKNIQLEQLLKIGINASHSNSTTLKNVTAFILNGSSSQICPKRALNCVITLKSFKEEFNLSHLTYV